MKLPIIIILFFLPCLSFSQKILQIEKFHNPKTKKYYPNNEIIFQVSDGQWYTRVITDLSYENNWIIFNDGYIALDEIMMVRSYKNRKWSQRLGNQLIAAAPVWGAYRGIAILAADDASFGRGDYWLMGSAITSGLLLRLIFKHKNYDVNKSNRFRLRILDLNIN